MGYDPACSLLMFSQYGMIRMPLHGHYILVGLTLVGCYFVLCYRLSIYTLYRIRPWTSFFKLP
jgi:hypothetical protein